jgi:hypothetical protein
MTHENYIGKHLLVALTYLDHHRQITDKVQLHGTITRITDEGIFFDQPNGEEFSLPPDLRSLQPATPGEYKLRSTGEVLTNPGFLSHWTINAPPPDQPPEPHPPQPLPTPP